jgi:hypothetical protein
MGSVLLVKLMGENVMCPPCEADVRKCYVSSL